MLIANKKILPGVSTDAKVIIVAFATPTLKFRLAFQVLKKCSIDDGVSLLTSTNFQTYEKLFLDIIKSFKICLVLKVTNPKLFNTLNRESREMTGNCIKTAKKCENCVVLQPCAAKICKNVNVFGL